MWPTTRSLLVKRPTADLESLKEAMTFKNSISHPYLHKLQPPILQTSGFLPYVEYLLKLV